MSSRMVILDRDRLAGCRPRAEEVELFISPCPAGCHLCTVVGPVSRRLSGLA